jgi:hypothetical protein
LEFEAWDLGFEGLELLVASRRAGTKPVIVLQKHGPAARATLFFKASFWDLEFGICFFDFGF